MRQITKVAQSIIKRKFILLLTAVLLLLPSAACAQVITSVDEQAEPLWPEQETITPPTKPNPVIGQNQGPPYGTIVMMQKPVSCNDTPIVENYIENTGGMTPITFGTTLNEMGGVMSLIQMYANPINKQFAVVEHFATEKSCILTHGSDFDIILPAQKVPN